MRHMVQCRHMHSVSIVIPVKDEADCLPRLLDCISRQTLQPVEVIVADAGSSDETRAIARAHGATVVEGGLPGVGRNRGAVAARGEWILFLDADVELHSEQLLENAMSELCRRNIDCATADVVPLDATRYDVGSHKFYNRYVRFIERGFPHAPGFFIFVKREFHDRVGGFDESIVFCEDHVYVDRVGRLGTFRFLNDVVVHASTRRQRKDGRFWMGVKFILAELHLWTIGPIRHRGFRYEFGHQKDLDINVNYGGAESAVRSAER